MKSSLVAIIFFTCMTDALKPKHLKGKFSNGVDMGFVDLPMTPQRARQMGWVRPPEDVFSPFIRFCDRRKPLVCIYYNKQWDIVKIAAIPTFQHTLHTDFRALTRSYTRVRLFGQDLYESSVWFMDPQQLKYNNLTVPDSKYVWGPIETVVTRIEPTAEGMRFVNLMHSQFCLEKMGDHYSLVLIDPVQYVTDPFSGELIGWEFIMSGYDGPQLNPLMDDNASFLIKRSDNVMANQAFNVLFSKLFSAFHVYLIEDPHATKCPDSLNNIIDAYDKRDRNDDSLVEKVYRKGGVSDPAPKTTKNRQMSMWFNW